MTTHLFVFTQMHQFNVISTHSVSNMLNVMTKSDDAISPILIARRSLREDEAEGQQVPQISKLCCIMNNDKKLVAVDYIMYRVVDRGGLSLIREKEKETKRVRAKQTDRQTDRQTNRKR